MRCGAPPDGTPVIDLMSPAANDGTVRCGGWRTGTPVGEPLTGHAGR